MKDSKLIERLGGPAKVADLLGYDKDGGVQRVSNWRKRGIPAAVKLLRPDLFMPGFIKAVPTKRPRKPAEQGA